MDFVNFLYFSRFNFRHDDFNCFYGPALLSYCLPLSYNFIFTIEHRFSIGFRLGFDRSHSIILSSVNLLRSKDSQVTLDIWEGAMSCKNTHFTLKLRGRVLCHSKKVLSMKSQQLSMFSVTPRRLWIVQNALVDNSSRYYPTDTSLLLLLAPGTFTSDKILLLANNIVSI